MNIMNINVLVSIIVPIYNVEKYLNECLNSILNQTYSNLQIILVNDGSTDGSEIIAQQYVKKDNRFILYNIPNQGVSYARNFGLDKILGDFVCFIDSDDFVSKNFILDFIELINLFNADVVSCGRFNVFENNIEPVFISDAPIHWTGKEAIVNMLNWKFIDGSVCDKMFKTSCFKNLRFKIGVISEDLPISVYIFTKSNLIINSGKANYYYRQRDGSRTKQQYNRNLLTVLTSAKEVDKIVSVNFPDLTQLGKKFILHHVHYLLSVYFRSRYISVRDELSFKYIKNELYSLKFVYFLPNKRSILKKIILLILIFLNLHSVARKFYHFFKSKGVINFIFKFKHFGEVKN
jgi:glycosyltransferase involved in cell wall biosynthesis